MHYALNDRLIEHLEKCFDPALNLKMTYENISATLMPHYRLTLGETTIWEFPYEFPIEPGDYEFWREKHGIDILLLEYLTTPAHLLLKRNFSKDERHPFIIEYWGEKYNGKYDFNYNLTDKLKAGDKRLPKDALLKWSKKLDNPVVNNIIAVRFDEKVLSQHRN